MKAQRGSTYIDYFYTSLTSAAGEGTGWSSRPGRFTPGKVPRYTFYWRLGGLRGPSVQIKRISPTPELETWNVQTVASRYTVEAILVPPPPPPSSSSTTKTTITTTTTTTAHEYFLSAWNIYLGLRVRLNQRQHSNSVNIPKQFNLQKQRCKDLGPVFNTICWPYNWLWERFPIHT